MPSFYQNQWLFIRINFFLIICAEVFVWHCFGLPHRGWKWPSITISINFIFNVLYWSSLENNNSCYNLQWVTNHTETDTGNSLWHSAQCKNDIEYWMHLSMCPGILFHTVSFFFPAQLLHLQPLIYMLRFNYYLSFVVVSAQ